MNRHPSTIASPCTATSGRRNVYNDEMIAAAIASNCRELSRVRIALCRLAAINEFSHQHHAPQSTDDWNDELRMMFAIQHPGVKLS